MGFAAVICPLLLKLQGQNKDECVKSVPYHATFSDTVCLSREISVENMALAASGVERRLKYSMVLH